MEVGFGLKLDVGEVAGVLTTKEVALELDVDGDGVTRAVSAGMSSPG